MSGGKKFFAEYNNDNGTEEMSIEPRVLLGKHIQDFRNSCRNENQLMRYSLNKLSAAWGLTEPTLSNYIMGRKSPRRENILKLAALMDLSDVDTVELMAAYGYYFYSKEYEAKKNEIAALRAQVC